MIFEVVIPSIWNISKLEAILKSINSQTLRPDWVIILVDRELTKDDFDVLKYFLSRYVDNEFQQRINFFSNINSDLTPWKGVSYLRNFGISKVKAKFLCFLDDDNVFEQTFFEDLIKNRIYLKEKEEKDLLLSPTILYRKSWKIQSQWIKDFNYFLSKMIMNKIWHSKYTKVKMIGSNSLFWPSKIFKETKYDENFQFVYEDIDFSYRIYKNWYPIIVSSDVSINHMERNKNKLEQSFIWDIDTAYQKAKNRMIFVRKNAELKDKLKFFFCGFWIQSIWFLFLIIFRWENRIKIIKSLSKGTIDWIKQKL